MKVGIVAGLLLGAVSSVSAFAPAHRAVLASPRAKPVSTTTARTFGVDPSVFSDLPQHVDSIRDAFSTLTLSDAMDAATSAADAAVATASDAAISAADPAVQAAATKSGGWFGFLTVPIAGLLQIIHSVLVAVGVSSNAWGVSIIMLTVLIKILTFPLTKTQLESTNKMQALQPTIKDLQAKYQSNPEVMNQKIAEVYQTNQVNPLAGCLPSLVQIPVFIGLYRAVLNLAAENKLDEAFLFLPNLEGPTYGADPTHGSDWLFQNWQNGTPSLGWDDTISFLILPVLLVISQFVSMELMQPKNADPQQQQANVILKVLPVMIGWFALNVPAALCIYWFVNNIVTTATTLWVRSNMDMQPVMPGGGGGGAAPSTMETSSIFAPPPIRDRPAGFGTTINTFDEDEDSAVKPITPTKTATMEAEVIAKETTEGEVETVEAISEGTGMETSDASKKKRGGKKKKKRRKN